MNPPKRKRVLAVSSGGGHWVQLQMLRPAFAHHDVSYVTVNQAYMDEVDGVSFHVVRDATRWDRLGLLQLMFQMLWIVVRVRPHVVLSTGAAPGVFALVFGKFLGARTAWIDSVANVAEFSQSAGHVRRFADLWLTQWPELAEEDGPAYEGSVL